MKKCLACKHWGRTLAGGLRWAVDRYVYESGSGATRAIIEAGFGK